MIKNFAILEIQNFLNFRIDKKIFVIKLFGVSDHQHF